jgi:hypothetical protein
MKYHIAYYERYFTEQLPYAIQSFMNQMLIMSISRSVQEALNYPK